MCLKATKARLECYSVSAAILIVTTVGGIRANAQSDDSLSHFRNEVYSVLQDNCIKCHGGEKVRGGLKLTSRADILAGGDTGPAVDLENPGNSLLLDMISYRDADHEMPPKEKLSPAAIDALTKWVQQGLAYDPELEIHTEETHTSGYQTEINDETRNYWAFKTIRKPDIPSADREGWGRKAIDAFVLNKLQAEGLRPNGPASRQQLIRRAYYDLIGLPPSLDAVETFEQDSSPDAFEKVIDHLLSRPQYGEKWGRHWLDLVRYAETNGYERDGPKAEAWRYRDYVIRAFNQDKPYDQFLREQVAGDEMIPRTTDGIIATGFQRLGIWDDEPADPDQAYYDGLDDVVATTSTVFLGLTVGCARCHDHKIDPVPQRDYYRILAFFHNTLNNIQQGRFKKSAYTLNTLETIATKAEIQERDREKAKREAELMALESRVQHFEDIIFATFSNPEKEDAQDQRTRNLLLRQKREKALDESQLGEYVQAKKAYDQLRKQNFPRLTSALSMRENGRRAPDTHVLVRGNAHVKGEKVEPGYPEVLGFRDPIIPPAPEGINSSGRRTVLANWMTSPENPLTARVIANRIWYYHFGRGIVRSPSNFGQNGEQPTHPELLDYLAATLIEQGWSLKEFHKTLMLSNTYQMSSRGSADGLARDPINDLMWRFDMRRLTAEEVRDSILSVTGNLNLKMGGPSIYTKVPAAVLATASRPDNAWGRSPEDEQNRRSVYVYVKRSLHEPMLKAFDAADTDSSCAVRFATTVPTQSLTMLNSEFVNERARAFAERLENDVPGNRRGQIERGLSLVTNRRPSAAELDAGETMIEDLKRAANLSEHEALERFCLMALNLNEFIYLD